MKRSIHHVLSSVGPFFHPRRLWKGPSEEKRVFLTFDDGPAPEITPWVLQVLDRFDAQGTFFCIGENVRKHPDLFRQIEAAGHTIGNHTFNHLNGWKTDHKTYLHNVDMAQRIINRNSSKTSDRKLFRPPYGKMQHAQARALKRAGFAIIMWSVLSLDFDSRISPEVMIRTVVTQVRPGSIIVFHDSLKARENLMIALPVILEQLHGEGYHFEGL